MKGLTWRVFVVLGSILFSLYLLVPTYLRYGFGITVPKVVRADDPWYFHIIPSEVVRLGLDLRGGVHLSLGIDFNEVGKDAVMKFRAQLEDMLKEEKVEGVTTKVTLQDTVQIDFPNDATWEKVDDILGKQFGQQVDFVNQGANSANIRLSAMEIQRVNERALDQALETLRNRIDEFGIAEPILQRQGDDKLLVQFPGMKEIGRLKEIISRTAKLSFQMERSGPEEPGGPPPASQLDTWVADYLRAKKLDLSATNPIASHTNDLNTFLASKLPEGTEIRFKKQIDINTREANYIPYLVDREPILTGDELDDAFYSFNQQNNEPMVNFVLSPTAASKFETATGNNIGRYMAIILDNNVHSAPRINSRIPGGRGVIEMGGGAGRQQDQILNDAKDTALVLRSGALPAKLIFLEERVIGPSLGADSIRAGTISLAVGLACVFIFISFYYRLSGLVAVFALSLNGLFILACLAAFEGTLSLPGLAGITLTLGMAVDSSVLIFEHMREELRAGKSAALSIAEGYSRAFTAIFDANLTTIIAGLVLLSFGYGPIKGFAVTLLIGLVCSMYTAVFVTRVVFDYFIVAKGKKTVSI